MLRLNDDTRTELKRILASARRSYLFGSNMEAEYIMDGCTIVGLNKMSDEELVEEYSDYYGSDIEDEFLARLKAELEIERILT